MPLPFGLIAMPLLGVTMHFREFLFSGASHHSLFLLGFALLWSASHSCSAFFGISDFDWVRLSLGP